MKTQPDNYAASQHLSAAALADYASALALGQPAMAGQPEGAAHLACCAACQAELDELLALLRVAYSEDLQPTAPPPLDLAFLGGAGTAVSPACVRDTLGRVVISFSEALLAALRPPALAGSLRGRQLLYRYVQEPAAGSDPHVTIQVLGDEEDWQNVSIWVSVDLPDRDPFDQSGSQVLVVAGDLVRRGVTDESGSVDLPAIPVALLPQLRFQITPPGGGAWG